jgi:hypothetical protein
LDGDKALEGYSSILSENIFSLVTYKKLKKNVNIPPFMGFDQKVKREMVGG